jgi:hypothetical protein
MAEQPRDGNGGPQVSQAVEPRPLGVFVYVAGPGQIRTEVTVSDPVTALGLLEVAKKAVLDSMGHGAAQEHRRVLVPQVKMSG